MSFTLIRNTCHRVLLHQSPSCELFIEVGFHLSSVRALGTSYSIIGARSITFVVATSRRSATPWNQQVHQAFNHTNFLPSTKQAGPQAGEAQPAVMQHDMNARLQRTCYTTPAAAIQPLCCPLLQPSPSIAQRILRGAQAPSLSRIHL
jgi:hypothetical protein